MENKEINVFIIAFNRLKYLIQLVTWLEKAGFEKIHIVDNASTYPPLLNYLKKTKHSVHHLDKNYGHLAVWECGKFKNIIDKEYYIVTDFDILPIEKCPLNVTEYFRNILDKYPKFTKVGFSLKIDDIPNEYNYKDNVIEWEGQFWKDKIAEGLFNASIDTTFALYRPRIYPHQKKWWKSIRTDYPYISRHLPWYENSSQVDEEDVYYQKNIKNKSSFWSVTDINLLKKYNNEIWGELELIYASPKWRFFQVIYKILNFILPKEQFKRKIGRQQKISMKDIEDIKILQKHNKELTQELGMIYASAGWNFFKKSSKR